MNSPADCAVPFSRVKAISMAGNDGLGNANICSWGICIASSCSSSAVSLHLQQLQVQVILCRGLIFSQEHRTMLGLMPEASSCF